MSERNVELILGKRKLSKLVDKILLSRLLPELHAQGRKYGGRIAECINRGNYNLNDVTTHIAPNFRAGELQMEVGPEENPNLSMRSFYKFVNSRKKRRELRKDYALSEYLHGEGVSVPAPVFKSRNLTVTELVQGDPLSEILCRLERHRNVFGGGEFFVEPLVRQIIRYHTCSTEPNRTVARALRERSIESFYDINRFLGLVHDKEVGAKHQELAHIVAREWECSVSEPLHLEPQGVSHNDFHSENIFSDLKEYKIIDWGDAAIGPIHYDVSRLLLATGFYQDDLEIYLGQLAENRQYQKMCGQIAGALKSDGYSMPEFYRNVTLAHAATRIRLARSTLKSARELRKNEHYLKALGSNKEQLRSGLQFIDDFATFEYTMGVRALKQASLDDLADNLREYVDGSALEYKSEECLQDFIERENPDILGSQRMESVKKQLGFVQEEDKRLRKDARRRRRARISAKATLASAVLLALNYGLGEHVFPAAVDLMEKKHFIEKTADSFHVDIMLDALVSVPAQGISAKEHDADIKGSVTTKIVPVIFDYLDLAFTDMQRSLLQRNLESHIVNNQESTLFSLPRCLDSQEVICYPHSSSDTTTNQRENSLAKLVENPFVEASAWLAWATNPTYYGDDSLAGVIEKLDFIYFKSIGLLPALFNYTPTKYLEEIVSTQGHQFTDERFSWHLLSAHVHEQIKRTGSIPGALLSVYCPAEVMAIYQNDFAKLINSGQSCAYPARSAYFSVLQRNGLDFKTLLKITELYENSLDAQAIMESRLSSGTNPCVLSVLESARKTQEQVAESIVQLVNVGNDNLDFIARNYAHLQLYGTSCGDLLDSPYGVNNMETCIAVSKDILKDQGALSYILAFDLFTQAQICGEKDLYEGLRARLPAAVAARRLLFSKTAQTVPVRIASYMTGEMGQSGINGQIDYSTETSSGLMPIQHKILEEAFLSSDFRSKLKVCFDYLSEVQVSCSKNGFLDLDKLNQYQEAYAAFSRGNVNLLRRLEKQFSCFNNQ